MLSGNCLLTLFALTTAAMVYYSSAAPAVCGTCANGACNNTDDGIADFDSGPTHNRTKRKSTIEQRSCVQFQLEMVLIPLSIAMIPVGLCALLLCACCCGPEESGERKMPDGFKKKNGSSKKEVNEIDGVELVCKDGVVMRRDSKKKRFSTAVSIIEARLISINILDDRGPSLFPIRPVDNENSMEGEQAGPPTAEVAECERQQPVRTNNSIEHVAPSSSEETNRNENERIPRRTSSKKTYFAENVSVLGDSNA